MPKYKDMTPEQKERVKKNNAASDKRNQKIVPLKMKISDLEKLDSHIDSKGIPRNAWIKQAINEKLIAENADPIFPDE